MASPSIALIGAFIIYVRTRWPHVWRPTTAAVRSATYTVIVASGAALIAVLAGGLHLLWALGGTAGLSARAVVERTSQWRLLNGIWGVLSIAGAAGILMMVHQKGRHNRFTLALALTWIGAGSMFAWGLWTLILVLGGITFGRRAMDGKALFDVLSFVKFMAGTLIGIVTIGLLADRPIRGSSGASDQTAVGRTR